MWFKTARYYRGAQEKESKMDRNESGSHELGDVRERAVLVPGHNRSPS